jgi:5'-deoxynucleotidase YfbR-like HD superfamily hydrolase
MSEVTTINFMPIYEAFAETSFGQKLAEGVRFSGYKPEDISNPRWVELLGADVNNLAHMKLTYGMTRVFTSHLRADQPELIDDHEENVMHAGAITHDCAESIVTDIDFNDITEADKIEEEYEFNQNFTNFYGHDTAHLHGLVREAIDTVIFTSSTKLGRMFNAIERTGYLRTALRASERFHTDTAPDCPEAMRWLMADVLGNQPPVLCNYAKVYTPIQTYLVNQSALIDRAYATITDEVFEQYKPDQREQRQFRFYEAFAAWENWKSLVNIR